MTTDVVVIGGGIAGLTAAVRLAREGRRVTVLERTAHPGGRGRSPGEHARMNLGPHAFYRGGAGERMLGTLGITPEGAAPKGGFFVLTDGRMEPLPATPAGLLTTPLLSWRGRLGVARLFMGGARDDESVSEWLARVAPTDDARLLGELLVRLSSYANAPESLPAKETHAQLTRATKPGVVYLRGGWQQLVDRLLEAARASGVALLHDRATALEETAAGVEVTTASGPIEAEAAVLAVEPRVALSLLPEPLANPLRAELEGLSPAYAACLDLVLDALPHPERSVALGRQAPIYLGQPSATAELGGHVLHAARYIRADEPNEPERWREELESALDLFQPGWRAHVVERRWMPRLVVTHALPQVGRRKPSPVRSERVFVTADWTGDGVLLDAAMDAVERVTDELVHRLPRRAA